MRPSAGEVDLAGETVRALNIERLRHRKAAAGHDAVPGPDHASAISPDTPALLLLIPAGGGDGSGKLDTRAQPVAVGYEPEVVKDLRLRSVLLRPDPLLLQFRVEAVRIVRGGYVTARPWVAVPVPRP